VVRASLRLLPRRGASTGRVNYDRGWLQLTEVDCIRRERDPVPGSPHHPYIEQTGLDNSSPSSPDSSPGRTVPDPECGGKRN
jgi:hypothetical protein